MRRYSFQYTSSWSRRKSFRLLSQNELFYGLSFLVIFVILCIFLVSVFIHGVTSSRAITKVNYILPKLRERKISKLVIHGLRDTMYEIVNKLHQVHKGRSWPDDYFNSSNEVIRCGIPSTTDFKHKYYPKVTASQAKRMEDLKNDLLHAKKALDAVNVPFWLEGGSLLGWYRGCHIIPHTDDNDITVPITSYNENIVPALASNGFAFIGSCGSVCRCWCPKRIDKSFVKPGTEFSFRSNRSGLKLDIFFMSESALVGHQNLNFEDHGRNSMSRTQNAFKNGVAVRDDIQEIKNALSFKPFVWNSLYVRSGHPRSDTLKRCSYLKFDLAKTRFLGADFWVPFPTPRYLRNLYGPGWDKPDSAYSWSDGPWNCFPNEHFLQLQEAQDLWEEAEYHRRAHLANRDKKSRALALASYRNRCLLGTVEWTENFAPMSVSDFHQHGASDLDIDTGKLRNWMATDISAAKGCVDDDKCLQAQTGWENKLCTNSKGFCGREYDPIMSSCCPHTCKVCPVVGGIWGVETYKSCMKWAMLEQNTTNNDWSVNKESALLRARFISAYSHTMTPRAEPLVQLAHYYYEKKNYMRCFDFASLASSSPTPTRVPGRESIKLTNKEIYLFDVWIILAECATSIQYFTTSVAAFQKIMENIQLLDYNVKKLKSMLLWIVEKAQATHETVAPLSILAKELQSIWKKARIMLKSVS